MNIVKSLPVIRTLYRSYDLWRFRNRWRKKNPHNKTFVGNLFPIKCVSVGAYSYGMLNVYSYFAENEGLRIGNFVSIAPGTIFLLGGNHQTKTITSFPLYSVLNSIEYHKDAESRGEIIIEDEVWIGMNVLILSGVKIGKGAIVAAGAVVTQNVPPYAIIGGNPAKVIRYRFSEEMIKELMQINLIDYSESILKDKLPLIYKEIHSVEDICYFVNLMKS